MNKILLTSDIVISNKLWQLYIDICNGYSKGNYRDVVLDGAHFVENIIRLLELELFKKYTPFEKSLPAFNNTLLSQFESAHGNESYRLLIPRAVKPIYDFRNKRNIGHTTTGIDPNNIDATLTLYSVKWVLAELVRINKRILPKNAEELISRIIERQLPIIWNKDGQYRILDTNMKIKDQILLILFDKSKSNFEEVKNITEYSNSTYLKKIIKALHKDRLLEYNLESGLLEITPKGEHYIDKFISVNGADFI